MSFIQHILILIIIILINASNTSTITIDPTTTQSIHEKVDAENLKLEDDFKQDEEQLKNDRQKFEEEKKQMQKSIKNVDVIQLNVGGQIIMTTRETLIRIPESILSIMFNGRWEHKLQIDQKGNIFLDFNPILFRHLLDQLQLSDIKNLTNFSPPSDSSLILPFEKMIRKLGLNHLLSLEKNIITINVDDQMITNQGTTTTQVSNSTFDTIISSSKTTKFDNKSDAFVDSDPKSSRHLFNQTREKPYGNNSYLEVTSNEENISFQRTTTDLISFQEVLSSTHIKSNTKWKQHAVTIAGGNGQNNKLNQLYYPYDIYVDDDHQCIYIADSWNHRILEWKYNAKNGKVVAGGKGQGNRMDQLNGPIDVIVDKKNDSLIICDRGNRRVVRWSRRNGTHGQKILSTIDCNSLTMDNSGNLYVSDWRKDEVKRWKIGETNGTIVAGGNEKGNDLNQLDEPTSIFVDEDHSVYVSDFNNHRVMKWMKGAKEGIVVAGGQGQGNSLTQLSGPQGVIVDPLGHVYVADSNDHRIIRWSPGSQEGSIVVGGNGEGKQPNQFYFPKGLSFDGQGHLYVVDSWNNRVQKFDVDPS